jgi:hypothetical protein
MTRFPSMLAACLTAAACAGHAASPAATAPSPAVAPRPATPPAPVPLRYAPNTGHYRYTSQSHMEQEMMGQVNGADLSTGVSVTVAIAPTAGNLGVAITIDSLAIKLPPGVPAPDSAELAAARGATVHLVTSSSGEPISLTPPESVSATIQQIATGFREFLPILPPGAPDSGATWTDSSSTTVNSQGIPLTVRTTRQHRVVGWEDRAGTRALHLATMSTYTLSGSGEAQGQQIDLAGGGQRTSDAYVSAAGIYLGGTLTDSSLVNANVVSAGMVVPVRSKTNITFTRLP